MLLSCDEANQFPSVQLSLALIYVANTVRTLRSCKHALFTVLALTMLCLFVLHMLCALHTMCGAGNHAYIYTFMEILNKTLNSGQGSPLCLHHNLTSTKTQSI